MVMIPNPCISMQEKPHMITPDYAKSRENILLIMMNIHSGCYNIIKIFQTLSCKIMQDQNRGSCMIRVPNPCIIMQEESCMITHDFHVRSYKKFLLGYMLVI